MSKNWEQESPWGAAWTIGWLYVNRGLQICECHEEDAMNTGKTTGRSKLDVRIILSALWAARMLSGLQGDSTRLHDPVALKELVAGTSAVPVTERLLLAMSMIFVVPILMSFLSLTLKNKANRRANLSIGIFFVAFDLVFLGLTLFLWSFSAYETFWSVIYVVFTGLVVWYAWKWPTQGG